VRIALDGGVVSLAVEDNGGGGRMREGNGISGMRERLAALDGNLDIHSNRAGTRLMARLPLPDAEPAAFSGRIAAAR
jgi:two-component system sensor histidine kinase DesK